MFTDGGNKLKLTAQKSHVRLVIQDAIENIRSMILFTHSFPDITLSVAFAKEALLMAAKAHLPETQDIYARLLHDDNYLSKIHPLVSIAMLHTYGQMKLFQVRTRICLLRGEVKEECARAVKILFRDVTDLEKVSQIVESQLQKYNYVFLSPRVSALIVFCGGNLTYFRKAYKTISE